MTRRDIVLLCVAVAALAGGAWFALVRSGGEKAALPRTVRTFGVCLACRQPATVDHPTREVAPFACPACKAEAVYTRFYCHACARLFVPALARPDPEGPPRLPVVPVCPCGSSNTAARNEHDPTQTPKGEAPLPKWP